MQHLTWAELLAYGDPSLEEKEREPVARHMHSCADCRDKYISIQSFRGALKKAPPAFIPFKLTAQCVPEEFLGDFMGNRLPSFEQTAYSSHMTDCDICFERAAYLASAGSKMAEGLLNMEPTPDRYKSAVLKRDPAKVKVAREPFSLWDMARRWIRSPIPAYAFSASLILFLFVGTFKGKDELIHLNGDQMFTLYEKPAHSGPSFGFSDAGRKVGEATAGLNVKRQGDSMLKFSWQPVEGADSYNFYLTELDRSGNKNIFDAKTEMAEVYTPTSLISPGSAYRWKVTGSTRTGEIFVAMGQFALPN